MIPSCCNLHQEVTSQYPASMLNSDWLFFVENSLHIDTVGESPHWIVIVGEASILWTKIQLLLTIVSWVSTSCWATEHNSLRSVKMLTLPVVIEAVLVRCIRIYEKQSSLHCPSTISRFGYALRYFIGCTIASRLWIVVSSRCPWSNSRLSVCSSPFAFLSP